MTPDDLALAILEGLARATLAALVANLILLPAYALLRALSGPGRRRRPR